VLVPITQMGFVIAALLGIFILREHLTVRAKRPVSSWR
jgi:uncharacterized membrane protein